MNLRPLGYEPNELPDCSTPRQNHPLETCLVQVTERDIGNKKSLSKLTGFFEQMSQKTLVAGAGFEPATFGL